jgi:hypothetical protein
VLGLVVIAQDRLPARTTTRQGFILGSLSFISD